ncbi:A24 family peptidase [Photobacterium leiognathi]|uniref:A24 family peptidase n=1 Tax=Photobacterium leiognathi TaxID=553611 RepID=UPI002735FC19|nr:prepilin peptidase [Photobacterium leiognathi]
MKIQFHRSYKAALKQFQQILQLQHKYLAQVHHKVKINKNIDILLITIVIVAIFDIRCRKIPNILCLITAICCLIFAYQHHYLASSLLSSITVLLGSIVLFYLNIMGAGDGKFAAALALAIPWQQLNIALFLTVIVGGVLAVIYFIKYRLILRNKIKQDPGLPYGVAIGLGFFIPILMNAS